VLNAARDLDPRLALIRALLSQRDLKRAETELAPLRRALPNSEPVLTMTGNLYYLKGDQAAARQAFDAALKIDPNSLDALSASIGLDLAAKNPSAARSRIEGELARSPRRAGLRLIAARTYAATGDLSKAEETLKAAIELDPTSLDAYSMLGQFYYQQSRLEDGRREFEQMLTQQPDSVQALTMLGIILNREGKPEESIRRYEEALAVDPRAGIAANNLAWLYVNENRNLDRALALGHVANHDLPKQADVSDTLGWIYYIKGFPSLALPYLYEAVQRAPQNAQFHYHLGAAYFKAKDLKKAKPELEQALKLSSQFDGADDAKKMLASLK
jgi:tetratricopeptide (TPR) repeat protein